LFNVIFAPASGGRGELRPSDPSPQNLTRGQPPDFLGWNRHWMCESEVLKIELAQLK